PREVHPLRDVILDTQDRSLTGHMHALRLRRDGESAYITMKGPPEGEPNAGRHRRDEWEEQLAEDALDDRERWPEPIRGRVAELIGEQPLAPIVEVHHDRQAWHVRRDGCLIAELALDEGEIRSGTKAQALHELEVELKGDGTEQDLDELARRLQQALPLVPEPQTKLERGLRLEQQRDEVPMEPRSPAAEAGRAVLRKQWHKLEEHEPKVREGDHDAVHDMRVATRRLRAMLEVLGDTVYQLRTTRRLRQGLKRLAAALGAVRDTEVLLEAVEAYVRGPGAENHDGIDVLLDELNRQREGARSALLDELDRKRTHKLLDSLHKFVTTEGAGVKDTAVGPFGAPLRVRDIAGSALWSRLETVQAFEPIMPAAPLPLLHELRIACKHLRYTLELFHDALAPEGKALHDDLVAAQDHLGSLHDLQVLLPLVDTLLANGRPNPGLRHYHLYLEAERDRLWAGATDVWAAIGGSEFRRRLADVLARL
ncbi:MAG TPA: CHAD domain-containing protein, partial [Herpetosiphonaceae bacterium]|nr:CHAD domain-containing protein [Herpetosiphonaceae bacterium]